MSIEVKVTCPLGHKCEEAKDGALHRCAWYLEVPYEHAGETINRWDCVMVHDHALKIIGIRQQSSTTVAVESLRNAAVETNIRLDNAMKQRTDIKQIN